MSDKQVNHGAAGSSGYIYQTFYAIIVSLKDDNWTSMKIEPLTAEEKTDIAFYNDDNLEGINIRLLGNEGTNCYKKIQVKKRTNAVSENEIRGWCNDLKADDIAEHYELCLFGSVSNRIPNEHYNNVTVLDNDLNEVIKSVKKAIVEYFEKENVADYSEEDLQDAFAKLFTNYHMNGIEQEPIKKDKLNALLKDILMRSPYNMAAKLKLKSKSVFYSNNAYARDLRTSRLDKSGTQVIKKALSQKEFPDVEKDTFESPRYNLFRYFDRHVEDAGTTRHIFLSGASGSGKSTYLYGLWKKYLQDDTKYIPIYVPLYNVGDSINDYVEREYLSHTLIKNTTWFKGDKFKKTPYHIILLLDGYNELADKSQDYDEKLKEEIEDFMNTDRITVIITSRNPKMEFEEEITRFKMCLLTDEQITKFLGGNTEFLEKTWYKGLLDSPFMLEVCVEAFGAEGGITSVEQASMEMILKKFIDKQIGRDKKSEYVKKIKVSVIHRLHVDILLPLAALELDKREKEEEICEDPKYYDWDSFKNAVNLACDSLDDYSANIEYSIDGDPGFEKYKKEIIKKREDDSLAYEVLETGMKLKVFSPLSERGIKVIWDHEIYRDYFVARGYALYSATHKNAPAIVNNLARQINYRYPEPGFKNTKVNATRRQYHVRKAQMYIDMVDARLSDHKEFDKTFLKELKKTAIYRRLIRDVALIYEDMQDDKMMQASDLCIDKKYYTDNLEKYDQITEYDDNYRDPERRYADAAYSLSSLAYNYTHERTRIKGKEKEYREASINYLEKARKALRKSNSIFSKLSEKTKEERTVESDILKYKGNLAAYYIGMHKVADNDDQKSKYLKKAKKLHEDNLRQRLEIQKRVDDNEVKIGIASSYNGIATCLFYMGEYYEAIENQNKAAQARPEGNAGGICLAYRNIVGCYAKLNSYTSQDAKAVIEQIKLTLDYASENKIYTGYGKLKSDIDKVLSKLTSEQRNDHKSSIKDIRELIKSISARSYN